MMWLMKSDTGRLDELDQRIVAALQVDGRASWRRIAGVLREPERTVARRGARLLSTESVAVRGFALRGEMVVLRLNCAPSALRVAATALARRPDTTFTYLMTGAADCAVEISCPSHRLAALVLDELPGTPGLVTSSTNPVLRYFRGVHEWQPGLLSADEAADMAEFPPVTTYATTPDQPRSPEERQLVRLLTEDGRRTNEELAVLARMSEPTVRRRIDTMRREGRLLVRAVVDPALLGLPVEALLWMKMSPRFIDLVGESLLDSDFVRYAVATAGEYQLLVHVAITDTGALHEFITTAPWAEHVDVVETSMIIDAPKRTGVLHPSLRNEQ